MTTLNAPELSVGLSSFTPERGTVAGICTGGGCCRAQTGRASDAANQRRRSSPHHCDWFLGCRFGAIPPEPVSAGHIWPSPRSSAYPAWTSCRTSRRAGTSPFAGVNSPLLTVHRIIWPCLIAAVAIVVTVVAMLAVVNAALRARRVRIRLIWRIGMSRCRPAHSSNARHRPR